MKALLKFPINLLPFKAVKRISPFHFFVPYYHVISDEDIVHIKHLYRYKDVGRFIKDIEFLSKYCNPIELSELINHIKHGTELRKSSFLLTFDDGYREIYSTVAPLLKKKGIPAVFFLNSDFIDNKHLCFQNKKSILLEHYLNASDSLFNGARNIEYFRGVPEHQIPDRILSIKYGQKEVLDELAQIMAVDFKEYLQKKKPYLDSEQIKDLIKTGFSIGAHSIDHPLYADLIQDQQIYQTQHSVNEITKMFNLNYAVFAFPESDRNVQRAFFNRISASVDLTFGTGGICDDPISTNIQRINFEKSLQSARRILAYNVIKKCIYQAIEMDRIQRDA